MEKRDPGFIYKLFAISLCLLIQPWYSCAAVLAQGASLTPEAAQAADILGIRQEAEAIAAQKRGSASAPDSQQLFASKALVLRKILQGILQIQAAENRLESEMAYTYDQVAKQQRKTNTVNQAFNILNFGQLGALYGLMEPISRIHKQFIQSAVGTCTGSGLAIGLPCLNIIYNKFSKASHLTPPAFISHTVSGHAVDGSNLPPLIARYMDLPAPGSNVSRREALNSLWQKRYKADMNKHETLCAIDDGKPKSTILLNSRIVLLWSLFTTIQGFDKQLLALLTQISGYEPLNELAPNSKYGTFTGLSVNADEAARLLHLEPLVAELKAADSTTSSTRKTELQITLMESVLGAWLEMRIAIDRCQEELNYQYDVVLAQMTARRGKFLQKTFEANFIQTGTISACAGYSFLRHRSKVGDELFIISNSLGLAITTVSLLATHGGWRKNETAPNSLADFFNLRANGIHGFSPLVWNFLNSSLTRTDGKTRTAHLRELWKQYSVSTMSLNKPGNLDKLASMPSCKFDTIKVVLNRISLLTSLSEQLGQFDTELLALLRETFPQASYANAGDAPQNINKFARGAAVLLGVQALVNDASNRPDDQNTRLQITRDIIEAFLDASVDANLIEREILIESQIVNKMTRQRDMAVQMTNIANFYQIGILGIISDALPLYAGKNNALYANRVNIVSGGLILGLAGAATLETQGGLRTKHANPNHLGEVFAKPTSVRLSPLMVRYLDAPSPFSETNLSRRQELIKYWKESKLLNIDVSKEANIEKLSAEGKAHHWWNENIKLINNRITMLYDLRALLRSSHYGLDELLVSIN